MRVLEGATYAGMDWVLHGATTAYCRCKCSQHRLVVRQLNFRKGFLLTIKSVQVGEVRQICGFTLDHLGNPKRW